MKAIDMEKANKYTPPERNANDYLATAAKAGIAAIPYCGGTLSEVFGAIITPSLEKRRNKWMGEVGQALLDIESRLESLESLQSKESFIDVALEASRIALSTSQEEIRSALINAILNSAIAESADEAKHKLFLHFLDTSTEWHIRFIKLFDDPPSYMRRNKISLGNLSMGGISHLINVAFPQLCDQDEFSEAIWNDNCAKKIFNTVSINAGMAVGGIVARRTTELGREFLKFIELS